jgi:hypothetical protein
MGWGRWSQCHRPVVQCGERPGGTGRRITYAGAEARGWQRRGKSCVLATVFGSWPCRPSGSGLAITCRPAHADCGCCSSPAAGHCGYARWMSGEPRGCVAVSASPAADGSTITLPSLKAAGHGSSRAKPVADRGWGPDCSGAPPTRLGMPVRDPRLPGVWKWKGRWPTSLWPLPGGTMRRVAAEGRSRRGC